MFNESQASIPDAIPLAQSVPNPPRLHWTILAVLDILTRGLFEMIWVLVLAVWVRKVLAGSRSFRWELAYLLFIPAALVAMFLVAIVLSILRQPEETMKSFLVLFFIGLLLARLYAVFTLRAELARAPIFVKSGYWMTLLFGVAYLQFCLRQFRSAETDSGQIAGQNIGHI